jgi:DNA-directed RNA polymerase subunit RPC12/RpoP
MTCSICGGEVQWQGPLSALTHTKCLSCGGTNCQRRAESNEDDEPTACPDCNREQSFHGRCDRCEKRAYQL